MHAEQEYLHLIESCVVGKLDPDAFTSNYMQLWREDRAEVYKRSSQWPQRFDLELLTQFENGDISDQQFADSWARLWGYSGRENFEQFKDRVLTACDIYSPVPEGEYELNPQEFRLELAEIYKNFNTTFLNA